MAPLSGFFSLTFNRQSYDPELESPNDMIIDPEEFVVEPEVERDDVAIINPDQDADSSGVPRADDCRWPDYRYKERS